MEALSFQINQIVVVENNAVPYLYDLAKIIQRTQNQDQAYQYQIKLYKQTRNFQGIPIETFKIKKITTKTFYFLKQKCSQFAQIAQSFRSIDLQLSRNQVFIEHEQKDKFWKRLFKTSVLSLHAKKSNRIKFRSSISTYKDEVKQKVKTQFKKMPQNKNKSNKIFQGLLQQMKTNSTGESTHSDATQKSKTQKYSKFNSKSKSKSIAQTNSIQKPKTKSNSKPKYNPKSNKRSQLKTKIINQRKRIIEERYRCLYLFGLDYIASQENTKTITTYFQQESSDCSVGWQKQCKNVQKYLDLLKKILFSLQLQQKNIKEDICEIEKKLNKKLKQALYSKFTTFPQAITEKIILILRIYYLKPILTMKSIIVTLKIWLKLFLQKINKQNQKTQESNQLQAQFKHSVEQILNFISLQ